MAGGGRRYLAGGEVLEADDGDAVVAADAVVVGRVGEGEGEDSLLLQVRLMDAGEAAHHHGLAAQVPRLLQVCRVVSCVVL